MQRTLLPENFVAPAMPVILRPDGFKPRHRPHIPDRNLPFATLVARPVTRDEIKREIKASEAMDLEYNKLRTKSHPKLAKKGCWDEEAVEEMHVVKERPEGLVLLHTSARSLESASRRIASSPSG